MALKHAQFLDVIDLHASAKERGTSASNSLFKSDRFQLLQVVLPAYKSLLGHHVQGESCIQCVTGEVSVRTGGNTIYLKAGQLIALPAGQPHAMQALTDATLLVTILRHAEHGSHTPGKE